MSIGSGLAHSLGFSAEATYGTYVAPTKWLEVQASALRKVKNTYQGGGMAAGRLVRRGAQRVVTTHSGSGQLRLEACSKGLGLLLNNLMGGTVTPVQQAATTAYLQTHALADPFGKMLTLQAGVPDLAGTVQPYTFLGSKVLAIEFSCGIDEPLMMTVEIDSRQVVESETLAAPSFSSVNVFHFAQSAIKLGTYNSEATVDGIKKMTLRIGRPSVTNRYYHGNAGLKSQPIINDWATISGTIEADYLDKTDFADLFAADTATALDWVFTGTEIESPYNESFRIRVPQIYFDGDTPVVEGPDVVSGSFPFVGQYDGTNVAASILYISTDTAL